MKHSHLMLSRAALLALAAAMLMLGACSHGLKSQEVQKLEKSMDMKVEAYKSGQFLLDDAVLSSVDLNSHFAYLRDQHRLPKTVLLTKSEDAKVGKEHLLAMARMQMNFGFTVYYDKGDKLVRLEVANAKDIPQLRQHEPAAPLPEHTDRSAKGGSNFPTGGGG